MTSDALSNRYTGEAARLRCHARCAGQELVAQANQKRTDALAEAQGKAHDRLDQAHQKAALLLGQSLGNACFLIGGKLILTDARGKATITLNAPSAANLAVDAGAQRLYWAETVEPPLREEGGESTVALMTDLMAGGSRKQLATIKVPSSAESIYGATVAVDPGADLLFLALPWGAVRHSSLAKIRLTKSFEVPPSLSEGGPWTLALDPVHRKIYWADSTTLGVACYDGSGVQTLAPSLPGKISMAVDGDSGFLYWNDGQAIWQAGLDGGSPRELYTGKPAGLFRDPDSRLLYWCANGKLTRAVAEAEGLKQTVFAAPKGTVRNLAVTGRSDVAAQRLHRVRAAWQKAQVDAARTVDQAHQDATQNRQQARQDLASAEQQYSQKIGKAQADAAARRQAAQDLLAPARVTAGQTIQDAKTRAETRRRQASIDAEAIKEQAQVDADATLRSAQDKLADARLRQQRS